MQTTENFIENVRLILQKLKKELGSSFFRFIDESTRRDTRGLTRSPSRRSGNTNSNTPLISQRSLNTSIISSFRVEEENILEIFGNVDVYIEKVSTKNLDTLALCYLGFLSKKILASIQINETDFTSKMIEQQTKANHVFNHSVRASAHEFDEVNENYDVLLNKVRKENEFLAEKIESTKKKNELLVHEKNRHEKEMNRLNEEKLLIEKNYYESYIIDEIKQFTDAAEKLNSLRIDLEENINKATQNFQLYYENFAIEQNSLLQKRKNA